MRGGSQPPTPRRRGRRAAALSIATAGAGGAAYKGHRLVRYAFASGGRQAIDQAKPALRWWERPFLRGAKRDARHTLNQVYFRSPSVRHGRALRKSLGKLSMRVRKLRFRPGAALGKVGSRITRAGRYVRDTGRGLYRLFQLARVAGTLP